MKLRLKERVYVKLINMWPLCDKKDGTIHFQFRIGWSLNQIVSIYFLFFNFGFNFILFRLNISSVSSKHQTLDTNDDLWAV